MCKFYSIDICLPVELCFQMALFTLDLSFKVVLACLVLICCWHTWHIAASTVWDTLPASLCEHLLPNHDLFQALTASLPAKLSWVYFCRQAGSSSRWKCFMWSSWQQRYFSHISTFTGGVVWKLCQITLHFVPIWVRQVIHRKCTKDQLEQISERFPKSGQQQMRTGFKYVE